MRLVPLLLAIACVGDAELDGQEPATAEASGQPIAFATVDEPPPRIVDAGTTVHDAGHAVPDAGHAPPDAGASPCAGATFALCDSFEGDDYDHSVWTSAQLDTGDTATTDTRHAYRGARALRLHLAQGTADTTAQLYEKRTFPALQNALYGRVFVYLEADPPAHNMSLVTSHQLSPHQGTYGVNINVTKLYAVQWNQSPHVDMGVTSATAIRLNSWMCIEWYHSGTGETRTWLDGTELSDLHRTDWIPVQFQQFDLGMYEPEANLVPAAGFDAWFDELALDGARIGCAN